MHASLKQRFCDNFKLKKSTLKMIQVKVKDGILEGQEEQNEYGDKFYSFKGIPFAEPPIGDLRFKAPKPSKPWKGVRSAKDFGPKCFQSGSFEGVPPNGSEDCLYLNIYTPEVKPKKLLPVMFWIHGGAFVMGSGDDSMFGPEFLVRHDVILVTINYRLGALGFLSLGTKDIPGNAGMKDQVEALKWVKENIVNFGGDPTNVTIFGESAGAVCVSYHLVSPMSKGLFKRAIIQSGTNCCWLSKFLEPHNRAKAIAKKLGCTSDDDKEIYEFLKIQPVNTLIDDKITLTYAEENIEGPIYIYGVVKEDKFDDTESFWSEDINDALKRGVIHEGVEIINGYTEDEGVLYFMHSNLEKILAQANKFPEFFVPTPFALNLPITTQLLIGRKFKSFYFKNNEVTNENLEELVRYINYNMFVYGAIIWQKLCANVGKNKTYLYKFTCKSERNVLSHVFQTPEVLLKKKTLVAHGDDLAYLFNSKMFGQKLDKNSKTFKMIEQVTKLWTNFAKYGDPTPDGSLNTKWNPYTLETQDYLDIGEKLVPETTPEKQEQEFWESIFREYYPELVL